MTSPPTLHKSFPIETLAPPGKWGQFWIFGIGPTIPSKEIRQADAEPRNFKVLAILGRTSTRGIMEPNGVLKIENGSSFFLTPEGSNEISIELNTGTLMLKTNKLREISAIEFECQETSVENTRSRFINASNSVFDRISYHANAPIFINELRIEDPKNHLSVIDYHTPYQKSTILDHDLTIEPEIQAVYALHREATNTSSDFYKFLCYYKILEGLLGPAKAELIKRAKGENISIIFKKESVPSTIRENDPYLKYVGQPLTNFFNSILSPIFRNAMAHFMMDNGLVLNLSSAEHMAPYREILHITEICAKVSTENYQKSVSQFYAALQLKPADTN